MSKPEKSFEEFTQLHRRLLVLQVLERSPQYTANDSVLMLACERFGYSVDRAKLRGDLHWLYDAAIIKCEITGGAWICTLTNLGIDVAKGRREYNGIQRPSPLE